ncbi:MAG: replication initiator protein [Microviridae sp.]|nr:MAG: replication initiator protein [Microviridae sp.]
MPCLRPITVKDRNGHATQIRCRSCRECKIRDVKDWGFRNRAELRQSYNAYFITLTYSDESTHFTGKLEISHVREYLKTLRNKVGYLYDRGEKVPTIERNASNLRFFAVGEYGDKFGRPHYHMILYNIPTFKHPQDKYFNEHKEVYKLISESWKEGLVHVGDVNMSSINYVCKYIFKQDGFRIMSKNPAIGKVYLTEKTLMYHQADKRFYVTLENGIRQALPEYYNKFLFDDADRCEHREKNQELRDDISRSAEQNIEELRKKILRQTAEERIFNKLKTREL